MLNDSKLSIYTTDKTMVFNLKFILPFFNLIKLNEGRKLLPSLLKVGVLPLTLYLSEKIDKPNLIFMKAPFTLKLLAY